MKPAASPPIPWRRQVGENVYAIAEQFVDEVVLVEDDAIRAAQALSGRRLVWSQSRAPRTLCRFDVGRLSAAMDENVAVVLSGANTTAVDFDS